MTSRQRVAASIEFQNPDRLPAKMDSFGNIEDYELSCLLSELGNDFIHNGVGWYTEGCKPGENTDEWGCKWLNLGISDLGQVIGHPLADISRLSSFQWPDPNLVDLASVEADSRNRGDKYFLLGYISIFERLINLRGFEDLLADIALEEEHLHEILDHVLGYNIRVIERLIGLNPDGIFLADDWGTQKSLMINPGKWRKLFLPAYSRMIRLIRGSGIHVFFHSDGKVTDILPDLLRAGVNVFWIEPGVNGLDWLAQNLRGKVAFLSMGDTQIMEFGTAQETESFTIETISSLGTSKGGFILYPDSTPSENNKVMLRTFVNHMNSRNASD